MHSLWILLAAVVLGVTSIHAQEASFEVQRGALLHFLEGVSPAAPESVCIEGQAVTDLRHFPGPDRLPGASREDVRRLREVVDRETAFASVPWCFWNDWLSPLEHLLSRQVAPGELLPISVPDLRPVGPYGRWSIWLHVSGVVVDEFGDAHVAILARTHISGTHIEQCTFRLRADTWSRVGECINKSEIW